MAGKTMNQLADEINSFNVPAGAVRLWWLCQAGFAFKNHAGKIVYLDPYLSDAVERLHALKRMSLAPIAAGDVRADLVICTHEHADHLDPDTVPVIARNNPDCRFAAPRGCDTELSRMNISGRRRVILEPGRTYDCGAATIRALQADHGESSPTALMLLLDFDGVRVFISGDTAWRPELIKPLAGVKLDVVIPVINGAFGNMNHKEAVLMVQALRPRIAIPCHFWMFADHGAADPAGFVQACRSVCPGTQCLLLKPGEGLNVGSNHEGLKWIAWERMGEVAQSVVPANLTDTDAD